MTDLFYGYALLGFVCTMLVEASSYGLGLLIRFLKRAF